MHRIGEKRRSRARTWIAAVSLLAPGAASATTWDAAADFSTTLAGAPPPRAPPLLRPPDFPPPGRPPPPFQFVRA